MARALLDVVAQVPYAMFSLFTVRFSCYDPMNSSALSSSSLTYSSASSSPLLNPSSVFFNFRYGVL